MAKKTAIEPSAASNSQASSWPRSAGTALWTLVVAAGFWGPYLHMPISMSVLTGLYGVFVLVVAATTALGFLRRGASEAK